MRLLVGTMLLFGACSADFGVPNSGGGDAAIGPDLTIFGDLHGVDLLPVPPVGFCGSLAGLQYDAPWPMLGYCPTHQSRSPYLGARTGTIRWKKNILMQARLTTPIVNSAGRLGVAHGLVGAVVEWYLAADGSHLSTTGLTGSDSVRSVPAVGAGGNLIVNTDYWLVNADLVKDKVKWTVHTEAGDSSPVIDGRGVAYTGGWGLRAVEVASGRVRWRVLESEGVGSSPALDLDGNVYFSSINLSTLAATLRSCATDTGQLRWSFAIPKGSVWASPTIGENKTVYIGSEGGTLFAIDKDTGKQRWSFNAGGDSPALPAIGSDGTVFFGSGTGRFYAIDPVTGKARWTYDSGFAIRAGAVVDADDTVYFGTLARPPANNFYSLDGRTGAIRWVDALEGAFYGAPSIGADGTIYVIGDPVYLYAIGP